jgi:HrpA-like RNA helicase
LVQAYQATVNADRVDIDLIVKLVDYILNDSPAGEGAILVFLPGGRLCHAEYI